MATGLLAVPATPRALAQDPPPPASAPEVSAAPSSPPPDPGAPAAPTPVPTGQAPAGSQRDPPPTDTEPQPAVLTPPDPMPYDVQPAEDCPGYPGGAPCFTDPGDPGEPDMEGISDVSLPDQGPGTVVAGYVGPVNQDGVYREVYRATGNVLPLLDQMGGGPALAPGDDNSANPFRVGIPDLVGSPAKPTLVDAFLVSLCMLSSSDDSTAFMAELDTRCGHVSFRHTSRGATVTRTVDFTTSDPDAALVSRSLVHHVSGGYTAYQVNRARITDLGPGDVVVDRAAVPAPGGPVSGDWLFAGVVTYVNSLLVDSGSVSLYQGSAPMARSGEEICSLAPPYTCVAAPTSTTYGPATPIAITDPVSFLHVHPSMADCPPGCTAADVPNEYLTTQPDGLTRSIGPVGSPNLSGGGLQPKLVDLSGFVASSTTGLQYRVDAPVAPVNGRSYTPVGGIDYLVRSVSYVAGVGVQPEPGAAGRTRGGDRVRIPLVWGSLGFTPVDGTVRVEVPPGLALDLTSLPPGATYASGLLSFPAKYGFGRLELQGVLDPVTSRTTRTVRMWVEGAGERSGVVTASFDVDAPDPDCAGVCGPPPAAPGTGDDRPDPDFAVVVDDALAHVPVLEVPPAPAAPADTRPRLLARRVPSRLGRLRGVEAAVVTRGAGEGAGLPVGGWFALGGGIGLSLFALLGLLFLLRGHRQDAADDVAPEPGDDDELAAREAAAARG